MVIEFSPTNIPKELGWIFTLVLVKVVIWGMKVG